MNVPKTDKNRFSVNIQLSNLQPILDSFRPFGTSQVYSSTSHLASSESKISEKFYVRFVRFTMWNLNY